MIYLFPDTNVLLHYPHPGDYDWCALAGTQEVVVVLTSQAVAEVDKLKNESSEARIKNRAKIIYRWISDGLDGKPRVKKGVRVEFAPHPPKQTFADHQLDEGYPDHRHIAAMLAFGADEADRIIVTADNGMRLNLRARSLRHLTPDETDRFADAEDPKLAALNKEISELRRLAGRQPKLELSFADGERHLKFGFKQVRVLSPADVEAQIETERQRITSTSTGESAAHFAKAFLGQGVLDSPEDRKRKVEKHLEELRVFLKREHEAKVFDSLSFRVPLLLSNTGDAPATDIDVQFSLPRGVNLIRMRDAPYVPERPEWDPYMIKTMARAAAFAEKWTTTSGPVGIMDVDGRFDFTGSTTSWFDDDPSRWHVENLRHRDPLPINVLALFENPESARTFAVDAVIKSATVIDPQEVRLQFVRE